MILVLVFIGVGLASFGALSLTNIIARRSLAVISASLIGGLAMVVGAEAALIGSSNSFYKAQQLQTTVCELEGETAHPESRRFDPERRIFGHILGCMKAAGYDWTSQHPHCLEAPVASNSLCYLPTNRLSRTVTLAQLEFE